MRIGSVFQPDRGATDSLLSDVASRLLAQGVRVAGAVQSNTGCKPTSHCDMDLAILPNGPVIRFSQSLGSASQGCRLDAGALEDAVQAVSTQLQGAELLIINKFGKHESEGRGFRNLIAEALDQGLPILIGINSQNRTAFADFAGDLAEPLAANLPSLIDWCLMHRMKIGA